MLDQYGKYKEHLQEEDNLKKIEGYKPSKIASISAYAVAAVAIAVMAMIFSQTTSQVFKDDTMRVVGAAAAIVVGASSVVFLIFKNKLLKSSEQFWAACIFVGLEVTALFLGALYAFGQAYNWDFAPFVVNVMHVAIILTFPLVAIEWLVVLALDPEAREQRAHNHSLSARIAINRKTRDNFLKSDPVMEIRKASALAEAISEEMVKLSPEQRGMFVAILRNKHGEEYNGVPLLLGDSVDAERGNGHSPKA